MAKNNSTRKSSKKTQPDGKSLPAPEIEKPFLIVGIGASAGGFEAFGDILRCLPTDTGMGFVFVQHLDPKYESKLPELLSRSTKLPVISILNNMRVEPNKVYILPQNRRLEIEQGILKLYARRNTDGQHLPIDSFFQSLAQDQGNCAVGVVLSGSNADGTLGLKEIKAEGGITFAQDERTASFHQMPSSAIAAGCVDFILPPNLIAAELSRLAKHPVLRRKVPSGGDLLGGSDSELTKIFALLRALNGVDFSNYKHSTLKRRILRRMVLQKTQHLRDYIKFLREHPAEIDALFHDLLINVTAFFRDASMYEALRKKIFPKIVRQQNRGEDVIRIWIPGCSSGEEVYSMAIALFEFLGRNAENKTIQIFATDISEYVLAKARAGVYSEGVLRDVSPERLRRFFHKADGGYQIAKFVRDCCVFARQNVIEDPPFSKLDLISCRNVLIYLGPVLQKRVMPIFHYALNKNGHLILGGSETIGLFSDLFTLVDKKNKIYAKRETYARPAIGLPQMPAPHETVEIPKLKTRETGEAADLQKQVDRVLISQYAPAGVVINSHMDVLQFRGQTSFYLEHSPGDASLNLMKMARPDLLVDLRTAISRAMKTDTNIRREGLELRQNGKIKLLNLQVIPIRGAEANDRFYVVLFEETPAPDVKIGKGKASAQSQGTERESVHLRDELSSTKESLQAIIEEQEATNEELKSANEEIQSANEELQSTNEELETAKEELQSTNEELTTLNEELQNRNSELSQVNNDLNNLLGSVNMPILMLGNDSTIRRFTPLAERIFNLIPTDIGRRISDINPNFAISNFEKRVTEVLETLRTQEHDVQDRDGRWFSLRIRPYRTSENKIDGAVVLMVDIDEMKRGLEEITAMIRQPLLILHGDLMINKANEAFLETFQVRREEIDGKLVYQIDRGAWNFPEMKVFLEGVLPEKHRVENYEIKHTFPKIGERTLLFSGRRLYHQIKGTQLILLAIQDVT